MICNNCNIRGICKIFDTINTPGVAVEMKSCAFRRLPGTAPIVSIDKDNMSTANKETLEKAAKSVAEKTKQIQEQRKSRAYQDISELSNKLKAEKEAEKQKKMKKKQPKVNIIETKEGEEIECEYCKTKSTSLINCPTCGKQICLGCAITSIDMSGNVLNLCEECWSTDAEKEPIKSEVVECKAETIEPVATEEDVKKDEKSYQDHKSNEIFSL